MRIAVASGKGGTGKTTVATSLALSLAANTDQSLLGDNAPLFLDCDVEAPNAHLFLKPHFTQRENVGVLIPRVDEAKCTHCGRCAEVCQYHAIAALGNSVLVFPQLCHGCGSCTLNCPQGAITEVPDVMGVVESGMAMAGISFARGVLKVGEPIATPVIRHLKRRATNGDHRVVIFDAPPGTACPVVETVRGADYVLLVTEPTPFGLHDLHLAVQVCHELGIPAGVIVNRDGIAGAANDAVDRFCAEEGLPILMRIPYERAIAEDVARGHNLVTIHPEYDAQFMALFATLSSRAVVRHGADTGADARGGI